MRIATLALFLPALPLALASRPASDDAVVPVQAVNREAAPIGVLLQLLQEEEPEEAPAAEPVLNGTFVPAEHKELEIWLQQYAGELLLVEVLPHGTYVNKGDVVARFDPEKIDEAIVDAHRALESAERSHHATLVRAEMAEGSDKEDRAARSRELERSHREHAVYLEKEVAFRRRQSEIMAASTEDRIEDMALELKTLESMYADDELIDATEEIVIQRSRRDLARARASQALSEERRKLQLEMELEHEIQRRTEGLEKKARDHERFVREQELSAAERAAGLEASERALGKASERLEGLKHDRELFEVHATMSGVLLHGSAKSQAGGRPDHVRGGRATSRTALFTIAEPDRLAVALELDAEAKSRFGDGGAVEVSLPGTERRVMGRLSAETYPTAASVGRGAPAYAARVELESPLIGVVVGLPANVHALGSHGSDPHARAEEGHGAHGHAAEGQQAEGQRSKGLR